MSVNSGLAVLFPGIGYNFDRPLMHFAREQAMQYGYDIVEVGYGGFPKKIKGDQAKMQESLRIAQTKTGEVLCNVPWSDYSHIIFYSKSIGTIVATQYAAEHHVPADQILFTPFPETFLPFQEKKLTTKTIAFHARTDPWMDDAEVTAAARGANVPMKIYPQGNHSLETGNTIADIRILEEIFTMTETFYPAG